MLACSHAGPIEINALNTQGRPVPMSAFASTKWIKGAAQTVRWQRLPGDPYRCGSMATTPAALAEMERLVGQPPPAGYGAACRGEEKLAGSQTIILYGFAILAVFLCLAYAL
jgi:multidrug efflux pump